MNIFHSVNHQRSVRQNDSLKSIAANNTIGTTQFRSIRKPKMRFPNNAPPLPKVSDRAAAITLEVNAFKTVSLDSISLNDLKTADILKIYRRFVGKRSTITQYTVLMPSEVSASNIQDNTRFWIEL